MGLGGQGMYYTPGNDATDICMLVVPVFDRDEIMT